MLNLWENPMLSIDDRLEAARGEIERLNDLLQTAADLYHGARSKIVDAEQKRDELLAVLNDVRVCLEVANNTPNGPIIDTIWRSGYETLFDFIDAELEKLGSGEAATERPN